MIILDNRIKKIKSYNYMNLNQLRKKFNNINKENNDIKKVLAD